MGSTNYGTQKITWSYKHVATSESFNNHYWNIIPVGIYKDGNLSIVNDTTVLVDPLTIVIADNTTKTSIKCETTSTVEVGVTSASNYIVLRYQWLNTQNNYVDFMSSPLLGVRPTDIVLGKANFTGSVLSSVDIIDRTYPRGVFNSVTGDQIIDSVALNGSPTTTTQATSDSSTKMATTAFVKNQKISDLSACSSLELISKITDETGTDKLVFSDSPQFSGTPSLPTGTIAVTQAYGDNSTKPATTAFSIQNGHTIGDIFFNAFNRVASNSFPALRLDDVDKTVTLANYPLIQPLLYSEIVSIQNTTSFPCSVTGNSISMNASTALDKLLAALKEDALVQGGDGNTPSYSSWRTITILGVNHQITDINTLTRMVTVSTPPATGNQTASIYPYRTATGTDCRLYKTSGRSLVGQGDADDTFISGLRRRDYSQKITGTFKSIDKSALVSMLNTNLTGCFSNSISNLENTVATGETYGIAMGVHQITFDSSAMTGSRAGLHNENRSMTAYLYMWVGVIQ